METPAPLSPVRVHPERIADARRRLGVLERKAARLGLPPLEYRVGELTTERVEYVDECTGKTRERFESFVPVWIEHVRVVAGPFELIAKVERADAGVIVLQAPGASAAPDIRFRSMPGVCEHCRTNRARRDCYIVANRETDQQLQVGASCLADFLGVDARGALSWFKYELEARDESRSWGGAYARWEFSPAYVLTLAASCARRFGYASKAQAEISHTDSTSGLVALCLFPESPDMSPERKAERRDILAGVCEADETHGREVLEWAQAIPADVQNEYMATLGTLARGRSIEKRIGFLVSAVSAHARELERELNRQAMKARDKDSRHVGAVGERLRDIPATLESARVVGSNDFGACVLVKLRDDSGNLFSWFTGKGAGMKPGARVALTGTVKKHSTYNGIQETQLSRCAIKAA